MGNMTELFMKLALILNKSPTAQIGSHRCRILRRIKTYNTFTFLSRMLQNKNKKFLYNKLPGHYPSHLIQLKHDASETEVCLRPWGKPSLLGPIDRASPYLSSLRNVVF